MGCWKPAATHGISFSFSFFFLIFYLTFLFVSLLFSSFSSFLPFVLFVVFLLDFFFVYGPEREPPADRGASVSASIIDYSSAFV